MKLLFIQSLQEAPGVPQDDDLEIKVAGSLADGLEALRQDRYEGVIVEAPYLHDAEGGLRETFATTQSPACHLLLSVSGGDDIPVETLMDGVDGYIEMPLQQEKLQELVQIRRQIDSDILKQRSELRRRDEEIATLVAISNIVTSNLEFVPLLAAIARETSRAMASERTTIFLYHADKEELEAAYAEGLGAYSIKMPSSQGIAGRVATSRQLLNVPEAYQSPYFNEEIDQQTGYETHSVLCVPLISPIGDLIGVAECLNKQDGIFTESDEQLLNMLSPLYAVAIENALLYQDLMEQVRQNERMTAERIQSERLAIVGRMASSVTKDIAEPMEEIVEHARHLGREDLTPEEKDRTCEAIEQVVDHLVDRAQELLDFSRGSLELLKDITTIGDLFDGIHSLMENAAGSGQARLHEALDRNTRIKLDLEKLVRALSRIVGALHHLDQTAFSISLDPAEEGVAVVMSPVESSALQAFLSTLDQPFAGTAVDHETGLRIVIAQQVIHAHGGIFERQPDGLKVRIPAA